MIFLDFIRKSCKCLFSGNRRTHVKKFDEDITSSIEKRFDKTKLLILAPIVRGRKGHYRELFENARKQGYVRARVDGDIVELDSGFKVDRYKVHDIELVVALLAEIAQGLKIQLEQH